MSSLKSLARINAYLLKFEWIDGFVSVVELRNLREECPCAKCKGESVMGQIVYPGIRILKPGMNELSSLVPTGNYGIQATWKDGHSTGIYTWSMLREIAEKYALTDEQIQKFIENDEK